MNSGLGDVKDNSKSFQLAVEELKAISGQKPLVTNSKLSVANFKVRKGMAVGAKVTLRGERMYSFFDKLVSIALPVVRDFRGVNTNLDGRGNYTLGIREQLIFPEIVYDQVEKTRGFDVTFVTTAKTDAEGKALLKYLGMPFVSIVEERNYGKEINDKQTTENTQVFHPWIHTLFYLRPSAFRFEKVRHLQNLL